MLAPTEPSRWLRRLTAPDQRLARWLWLVGAVWFAARWGSELFIPMHWTDNKAWFYVRDYLTLMPAAVFWTLAVVRGRATSNAFDTRTQKLLAWAAIRPAGAALVMGATLALACLAISVWVYRTAAHILDEADYLFQAKIFATGQLFIPPPSGSTDFFRSMYVVLQSDRWYGSFFPGPSLSLVPGVLIGTPYIINPILSGMLLLVTVWAGRRLYDARTGLLAGLLVLASPFVLLQGASYFSHVLTALFFVPAVSWLLAPTARTRWQTLGVGLCAGGVLLCRPLSAVLLGAFALVWWSILVRSGQRWTDIAGRALLAGIGCVPGVLFLLWYNHALTGNPFVTPHHVALPDERIGPGLHMLTTTGINLIGLGVDLIGVPLLALVPLAVFAMRRSRWRVPFVLLVALYVLGYSLYPYHGLSYGPRFYFEIVPFLSIAVAHGFLALPTLLDARWASASAARALTTRLVLVGLVISLVGVLPQRMRVFAARGAYFDIRAAIAPALSAPSLVFVETVADDDALAYLAAFQHIDVRPDLPILFARDLGDARNRTLIELYPDRRVYRLDVDTDSLVPYTVR